MKYFTKTAMRTPQGAKNLEKALKALKSKYKSSRMIADHSTVYAVPHEFRKFKALEKERIIKNIAETPKTNHNARVQAFAEYIKVGR